MNGEFTKQGEAFWNGIPEDIRHKLIDNVWCVNCSGVTTITDFKGQIEKGDLVLYGKCKKCEGEVVRVIEG